MESVLSLKKKTHCFPTFKLHTIIKHLLWLTCTILFLSILVYDLKAIEFRSVVYIFHSGIIS